MEGVVIRDELVVPDVRADEPSDCGATGRAAGGAGVDRAVALHVAVSLGGLGNVRVRRVGRRYAPLGVVADGAVYFKAGPDAVTRYLACGMRPLRAAA